MFKSSIAFAALAGCFMSAADPALAIAPSYKAEHAPHFVCLQPLENQGYQAMFVRNPEAIDLNLQYKFERTGQMYPRPDRVYYVGPQTVMNNALLYETMRPALPDFYDALTVENNLARRAFSDPETHVCGMV